MVVGYYFTKWMEAILLPNMEEMTCAKAIVEEVVTRFETPRILHSDQGEHLFQSCSQKCVTSWISTRPELQVFTLKVMGWWKGITGL